MALDFSKNWKVWDNTEPVTIQYRRTAGNWADGPVTAKRRAPTFKEVAPSGGAYRGDDLVWLVPAELITQPVKPADKIEPADAIVWTVLTATLNSWQSWWKLMCRSMVLAYDLRDTLTVWRPDHTRGPASGRLPIYSQIGSGIPAKFQLTEEDATDQLGKRRRIKRFTCWAAEYVDCGPMDQIRDGEGNRYTFLSSRNANLLDTLHELSLERLEGP